MLQHQNMLLIQRTLASTVLFALLAICGAQTKLAETAVRIEDHILKSEAYDKRVRPPGLYETHDENIMTTSTLMMKRTTTPKTKPGYNVNNQPDNGLDDKQSSTVVTRLMTTLMMTQAKTQTIS
ncbi:glutamate-gated chloride channel [Ixodes scapularis]